MIDLQVAVKIVLYIMAAALVFSLLLFLIEYIARQFPSETMSLFSRIAKIALVVLAILVIIGIIISVLGGTPLFRWGPTVP